MSAMAGLGFVGMLAALAWFAWCLVRMFIGPGRGKALGRAGIAVFAFIGSGVFAGWNLAPAPRVAPANSQTVSSNQSEPAVPTAPPPGETSAEPQLSELTLAGRYQTAPTLVALVVAGFIKGEESRVEDLARAQCHSLSFCSVGIWTDDALAPRKLKMTDAQVAGRLGQYVHSAKTGVNHMLWNCAISQHSDSQCLP